MRTANAVDSTLSSLDPFEVVWFRKRYFIVTFYRDKQEKKGDRCITLHSQTLKNSCHLLCIRSYSSWSLIALVLLHSNELQYEHEQHTKAVTLRI